MKKTSAIISGTVLALGATGVVANAQADDVTTPDVTSTVQADKQGRDNQRRQVTDPRQRTPGLPTGKCFYPCDSIITRRDSECNYGSEENSSPA